jgi:hypothetical protein
LIQVICFQDYLSNVDIIVDHKKLSTTDAAAVRRTVSFGGETSIVDVTDTTEDESERSQQIVSTADFFFGPEELDTHVDDVGSMPL